ncbi:MULTISPECIES: hypothetical protein [Vibrio]|uniref:Uncharacterized protein n=1 Tax=Vibrio campbellii (strain ATCC BAA-1116) TaxID=2902295 RepID=A7N3W9_VIBC1|nr:MULTISPECIES: hypothetical protein [Vibrio]ABU73268.1 hypothetical protein VIBHAR_05363 [Vibrio campbellii ATCC BAA-1116]AGU97751.1 hypothetical protein M892_24550 [Vibrio campbellii ATCC BAA-1116]MBT0123361.1 hypothetical protein [Vibrio campbellii]MBT0138395.1 hypothetical protein [Vibrio campbellii]MBT0143103.1 hypothetical protein [Vibrio campbellii]
MKKILDKLKQAIGEVLDFHARVWVVNVYTGEHKGESYVVNEDSFSEPLQWMKKKGYKDSMLTKVESMKRSQIIEFDLGSVKHRLMRVK